MKAIIFEQNGGVEVLKAADVAAPEPGPGEVQVRVKACALNHLDIWVRQGLPGVKIEMPHILGCEPAGEISKLGAGVKGLEIGQRVLLSPGQNCGACQSCVEGNDSSCPEFDILGMRRNGGYAETITVPARHVIPVSGKLKFEEWAAIPLTFVTAWHMLFSRATLKPTDMVLVMGGGSGVGVAAIQICKLAGARVITTAGSDEKCSAALALGADHAVNHNKGRFKDEVLKITNNRGVNVVFEHIGPAVWDDCIVCLAKDGTLVTCGATSGPDVKVPLRFLYARKLTLMGSYMGSRRELNHIVRLVEEGRLKPVIDRTFPLAEAAKAQQHMLDRKNFGKIVLTM